MESDCRITVLYPIMVERDDGLSIKLLANSQYCFKEEGYFKAPVQYVTKEDGTGYGYKVESGESFFIAFSVFASIDVERFGDDLLSLNERNRKNRIDPIKDHKAETLKNLGHDIKEFERADYNGQWLQDALKKRSDRQNDKPLD